jgi:hypothetical protein
MAVEHRAAGAEPMKAHGYVGIVVILAAETLLFSGNEAVGRWFTPIVWTGYVLFVDALTHRATGRSLLVDARAELLLIAVTSIAGWWLFEFYNAPRFWQSDVRLWWHYEQLETNPFLLRVGYDWAFATISPALFLTAQLFTTTLIKEERRRAIVFPGSMLWVMIVLGGAAAALPLIFVSRWFVPLVWLSYIFLLDPINFMRGQPSIVGDLAGGRYRRLSSLLASGALCGVLWEFWNYWAVSKWTYTVPYLGDIKIFEMPVLGFLGFPPFAVECWVMYIFVRGSLLGLRDFRPADEAVYPVTR